MQTAGHLLLNETLPEGYHINGPVTTKELHASMVRMAKADPRLYAETITKLKRRGDEITSLEGISVGLDDIAPDYKARDAIMLPAMKAFDAASKADKPKILIDTQNLILEYTKKHPGSMTLMATSGARGKPGQLMKIVGTPLGVADPQGEIIPWMIHKSYSEGVKPSDYWVALQDARQNHVQGLVSVSEPGEATKLLVANMTTNMVTKPDCGTHNGIQMSIDDSHVTDRFLANDQQGLTRNTVVTARLIQELRARGGVTRLLVRSPMTCAEAQGVCQHCWGLSEQGKLHGIGINVGVRSAQAMSEPLTQMALSSKHGVLMIKPKTLELSGLKGVRQFLEIPKIFKGEAVISPIASKVVSIEKAPQGGHFITVKGVRKPLYAEPRLSVTVAPGDTVEAGDTLTNGVPRPDDVVAHKGIGAGRDYFVKGLHKIYDNSGVNLDKRHFELLAKSELSHVRFADHDDNHPEFLKGDIVHYNAFAKAYEKDSEEVPIEEALNRRLSKEIHHHTVGTLVTPNLIKEFRGAGIKNVSIARHMPDVEFIMKPLAQNPLLDPDWLGRLAHRHLKGTIAQAVHTGQESDIHGYHPVPAFAYGAELRHGPNGTY